MKVSQMEIEARETPLVLSKQFSANQAILTKIIERLQQNPPPFAMTIARGSSDHAALFAKYLLETRAGLVTASAAPSVSTLYRAKLKLKDALVIAISQSGQSPDITQILTAAREEGALTVAFVNETNSPLAQAAEYCVPLFAGAEKAVAATKSYLATLGALIQFTAMYTHDALLLRTLQQLPETLQATLKMDWSQALTAYRDKNNTFVLGRSFGFAVAQEAALKFKEITQIHAEAFSGAEFLHGPFALVQKDLPLLLFGQHDESLNELIKLAEHMKKLGAKILFAAPLDNMDSKKIQSAASIVLPLPKTIHPILDPLVIIQAFYIMIAQLATARGLNPDEPFHIKKVTQTW